MVPLSERGIRPRRAGAAPGSDSTPTSGAGRRQRPSARILTVAVLIGLFGLGATVFAAVSLLGGSSGGRPQVWIGADLSATTYNTLNNQFLNGQAASPISTHHAVLVTAVEPAAPRSPQACSQGT